MELTKQEKIDYLNTLIDHADIHIKSVLNNIKNDPDYGVKGGKTRENIIQDFIDKKAFYSDQLDKLKAEML